MKQTEYETFLTGRGYSPETIRTYLKSARQTERYLSYIYEVGFDTIVSDDRRMEKALSKLLQQPKAAEIKRDLRMYYYFVHGKWFDGWRPRIYR